MKANVVVLFFIAMAMATLEVKAADLTAGPVKLTRQQPVKAGQTVKPVKRRPLKKRQPEPEEPVKLTMIKEEPVTKEEPEEPVMKQEEPVTMKQEELKEEPASGNLEADQMKPMKPEVTVKPKVTAALSIFAEHLQILADEARRDAQSSQPMAMASTLAQIVQSDVLEKIVAGRLSRLQKVQLQAYYAKKEREYSEYKQQQSTDASTDGTDDDDETSDETSTDENKNKASGTDETSGTDEDEIVAVEGTDVAVESEETRLAEGKAGTGGISTMTVVSSLALFGIAATMLILWNLERQRKTGQKDASISMNNLGGVGTN